MGEKRRDNHALRWMRAVRDSTLESSTKLVLLTLGTRMDPDGTNCFPSIRDICDMTSLSNRTVIDHLDQAADVGWIERRTAGRSGRGWKRHCYVPCTPEGSESTTPRQREGGEGGSPRKREGGEPDDDKVVKQLHSTSSVTSSITDDDVEGGEGGSPPRWPAPSDLPKSDAGTFDYPEPFEEIWTAYPRRNGKKAAYRKVRALVNDGEDPDALRTAAAAYAAQMRQERRQPQHIKLAATFFGPDDWWRERLQENGGPPDERPITRDALPAAYGGSS